MALDEKVYPMPKGAYLCPWGPSQHKQIQDRDQETLFSLNYMCFVLSALRLPSVKYGL